MDCKDKVNAEGKPASLRDLGAYPNSLIRLALGREGEVRRRVQFLALCARTQKVDCDEKDGQWMCTRTAKPCKDLLNRASAAPRKRRKKWSKTRLQGRVAELLRRQAKKRKKARRSEAETGWEIDARKKHGKE